MFSIDQGVGVRAISGDKTAFAYSDEISERALLDAAGATRTIARRGAGRVKLASSIKPGSARALYHAHDPVVSLDATAKVQLLERIERLARAKDPRIVQVMAGFSGEHDVVLVVRSDGVIAADVRPIGSSLTDCDRRAELPDVRLALRVAAVVTTSNTLVKSCCTST
jgi:TldD protein